MEEPEAEEVNMRLLGEAERFRKNARAFLIALAQFVEACETQEERRARNNPSCRPWALPTASPRDWARAAIVPSTCCAMF